ncbi:MAG TPA: hypothetical protein VLC09_11950, partial [Polyangiaceae bacterium]|nr:hypothetical protein [Polyangiaceae bacterium]
VVACVLACAPGSWVIARAPARWDAMKRPPAWSNSRKDWELQHEFERYARDARRVAASRPIFAFRAGKPVPAALAVTSWKRFRSDQLSSKQVARELRKYEPEVVLLTSRWPHAVRAAARRELERRHRKAYHSSHQSAEIWVLRPTEAAPGTEAAQSR